MGNDIKRMQTIVVWIYIIADSAFQTSIWLNFQLCLASLIIETVSHRFEWFSNLHQLNYTAMKKITIALILFVGCVLSSGWKTNLIWTRSSLVFGVFQPGRPKIRKKSFNFLRNWGKDVNLDSPRFKILIFSINSFFHFYIDRIHSFQNLSVWPWVLQSSIKLSWFLDCSKTSREDDKDPSAI